MKVGAKVRSSAYLSNCLPPEWSADEVATEPLNYPRGCLQKLLSRWSLNAARHGASIFLWSRIQWRRRGPNGDPHLLRSHVDSRSGLRIRGCCSGMPLKISWACGSTRRFRGTRGIPADCLHAQVTGTGLVIGNAVERRTEVQYIKWETSCTECLKRPFAVSTVVGSGSGLVLGGEGESCGVRRRGARSQLPDRSNEVTIPDVSTGLSPDPGVRHVRHSRQLPAQGRRF